MQGLHSKNVCLDPEAADGSLQWGPPVLQRSVTQAPCRTASLLGLHYGEAWPEAANSSATVQNDSPAGKRIRVESGARSKGKDTPSGLYQKWAKSQKRKVPGAGGRVEDSGAQDRYSKDLANRWAGTTGLK